MKPYHLILDFTHVYDDEICADREQFSWIDCSDIEGSDLYCSPQAVKKCVYIFLVVWNPFCGFWQLSLCYKDIYGSNS